MPSHTEGQLEGMRIACAHSLPTNELGYCGPSDSSGFFRKFLKDASDPDAVRKHLERFEGLYPYLELIASKHGKDPLDKDVVEAYFLGNDLLEGFTSEDYLSLLERLSARGLPRIIRERLEKHVPDMFCPHHSFNVFYIGVGSVTGSVPYNLESINNCLVLPAKVLSASDGRANMTRPHVISKDGRFALEEATEDSASCGPWTEPERGDTLSVHWKMLGLPLTAETARSLLDFTMNSLRLTNETLVDGRIINPQSF